MGWKVVGDLECGLSVDLYTGVGGIYPSMLPFSYPNKSLCIYLLGSAK
jgi:hypothetical protein